VRQRFSSLLISTALPRCETLLRRAGSKENVDGLMKGMKVVERIIFDFAELKKGKKVVAAELSLTSLSPELIWAVWQQPKDQFSLR
jgi:hypothetical protein